ncbi:phospho-2-dehydro-3-deoxyheptonate aldolase [Streptomyces alkaliphilus]|uniref:Phospho-2-dehydro-3-deoxyheptonate aldolase n=1 Tax=Streptomyces alkaliphilus TaxID=1472722 RepID=A0A7W3XZZ8_9ACTN|nr:3-deoxy-7-phosphoheptulonate synthase [Streptomyces alkaliphilus]MBB0243084.1 phospho-2-dehydro-3-deoxyheptonate aldolase [Streptomyces alkaliphilus]
MNGVQEFLRNLPAVQQPDWQEHDELPGVTAELASLPPLVDAPGTDALAGLLAEAAAGRVQIIQAGDCAEDWAESSAEDVARKAGLLDVLAGVMRMTSHRPVLRVGRIAGQYGKPRSKPTEIIGGVELPVYRGHAVNAPEPDPQLRIPDPTRMLTGYRMAREVVGHLGWGSGSPRPDSPVWTSHEALLLDYELPMLRAREDGGLLLTSTHWPWIGERTRHVEGAHVALLAAVSNPVACKVGPTMTPEELLALCERLDPERVPGRLTLISRMGADKVGDRLPALVGAVREAGHPVVWLCDPMHGNTVNGPEGVKTRLVTTLVREVVEFRKAVRSAGGTAGGLHLETTPDDVTECVADENRLHKAGGKYLSFCDPRLNPQQAITVASAWLG